MSTATKSIVMTRENPIISFQ